MKKVCILFVCILINISSICFASNFNMSYVYGGTTEANIQNAKNTNGAIDEVSPSYFDINEDGSLKMTNYLDTKYINEIHKMNIKVVPFLSNHWNREVGRAALNNYENLASQIIEAIYKYNLDGVNVDIENVTEFDKENYTNFVKMLRENLSQDKVVAVAVAANPKGWQTGWHGSYDYTALGKYADYIMVMAYDEHYEGGKPGAVASYDFVKNSIEYALKYVPKEKIVVGLAFFGRYWNEEGQGGRGVNDRLVMQILDDYNAIGEYDIETRSMKSTIYVTEEQASQDEYIFPAGTYTFWYENAQTIKEKIELINSYGLKGTGSWSLGQETQDIWNLDIWKKDEYEDVTDDMWSKDAICYLKENKLMLGKEDNNFKPKEKITRAEVATVISRLIDFKNINIEKKKNINLTDIQNSWAKDSIQKCIEYGIINGYEDNTFKPNNEITRAELVTMIHRLNLNLVKNNDVSFTDIQKNQYYYDYVISLADSGIINGYEDGTFKPMNKITREETANILYKICKQY